MSDGDLLFRSATELAPMVSDAFLDSFPHEAAAQRVGGKKLSGGPLPQKTGDVLSVKASAQLL